VVVDDDQRHAAFAGVAYDGARVDALVDERPQDEIVGADAADEARHRAEAGAGGCLVRALAAWDPPQRRLGDRLARPWQPRAARDEVDVGGADDSDPGDSGHARPILERRTRTDTRAPARSPRQGWGDAPTRNDIGRPQTDLSRFRADLGR